MLTILLAEDLFCFARQSYLQANRLEELLTLVLFERKNPGDYCMEGSIAIAELEFSEAQTCLESQQFVYTKDTDIEVNFDALACDFSLLVRIPNAQVRMTLGKVENYILPLNRIVLVKDDVRQCWRDVSFEFSVAEGDEVFRIVLEPNPCQIPEETTALLHIIVYDENRNIIFSMPEFTEASEPGGYKYGDKYDHMTTAFAELKCRDAGEFEETCLRFMDYISGSLRYWVDIRLEYLEMGEIFVIQQTSSSYSAIGSQECAQASKLESFQLAGEVLAFHLPFGNILECWNHTERPDKIRVHALLISDQNQQTYSQDYYDVDAYFAEQHFQIFPMDEHGFADLSLSRIYYQTLFFRENGSIFHSFSLAQKLTGQCVYAVAARIIGNKQVVMEYCNLINGFCGYTSQETIEIRFYNKKHELLESFSYSVKMNYSTSINIHRLTLDVNFKAIRSLSKQSGITMVVNGIEFFYVGSEVYNESWLAEVAIIMGFSLVYLCVGLGWVFCYIRRKPKIVSNQ